MGLVYLPTTFPTHMHSAVHGSYVVNGFMSPIYGTKSSYQKRDEIINLLPILTKYQQDIPVPGIYLIETNHLPTFNLELFHGIHSMRA